MSRFVDRPEEVDAEGQMVIITARWILIIGAMVLTLWNPAGVEDLWKIQVQSGLLLVYAVINFFLHAQYMRQGEGLTSIAYVMSLADLALISFVILIQGQIASSVFVFYLPAMLAISVAFSKETAALFTGGVVAGYLFVALIGESPTSAQFQELLMRIVVMVGVAFVGGLFRHIEEQRLTGKAKPFAFMGGKPRTTSRASRSDGGAPASQESSAEEEVTHAGS
jgi:hypothetical protein